MTPDAGEVEGVVGRDELDEVEAMFADYRGSEKCCPISGDLVYRLIFTIRAHTTWIAEHGEGG